MRALVSVYDKTGVVEFCRELVALGWEIYSTGGTMQALAGAGVLAHKVEEITHFPELLGGRVKTLHPAVHAGILARRDIAGDRDALEQQGITPIDLVVVNLYPFRETIARPQVSLDEALENIDIGGPTLLRSAAKNFPHVVVVVDPADYASVVGALQSGGVDFETRRRLAQKAFQHAASYDTAIAQYLRPESESFPDRATVSIQKVQDLRYGENPHQQAALYREETLQAGRPGIVQAQQLWGKDLSFNNLLDLDAVWQVVTSFAMPTVAIVKHNNPIGIASDEHLIKAYGRAYAGDPIAAFGGVVGLNRRVDRETAEQVGQNFFDAIIAPAYDEDALATLRGKKNLRVLALPATAPATPNAEEAPEPIRLDFRRVSGGFLVQTEDVIREDEVSLRVVTERPPTLAELTDLMFAWRAVKYVKSNAIVLARRAALVGMGAGQPSRVASVEIALKKAGERSVGSVLASDAFFPFPDGVEAAAVGGVTAIIQPGGSIRDEEVVKVANRHHLAMVFTGRRHFRH